jgi:polysaccharide biosynthesis protein PslH
MKILMLFQYAPLPPPLDLAGTKRNLPFLLELTKHHEVSVLSFGTPEEERLFRDAYGSQCSYVRFVDRRRSRVLGGIQRAWLMGTGRSHFRQFFRPAMQQAIFEMAAASKCDLIHCCSQMFGCFQFPSGVPVTSDTHEVTHRLLERNARHTRNLLWKAFFALASMLGKPEESRLCRKFDLLIATTEVDFRIFRADLPGLLMAVIQNGVGQTFFEDLGLQPEASTMVFTGLFTHRPNSEGISYFLDKIFPRIVERRPDARIFVVGKSPTPELRARASERIIVTGFVDDVRPYMARAQVYVIPLLAGGGIRGKALEAMAMRRPIVTTTVGVEGIHLKHEDSALFADSPDSFADAVLRLFRDDQLRQTLADRAFSAARQLYNWESKGRELDLALRWVAAARSTGRARAPKIPGVCAAGDRLHLDWERTSFKE